MTKELPALLKASGLPIDTSKQSIFGSVLAPPPLHSTNSLAVTRWEATAL